MKDNELASKTRALVVVAKAPVEGLVKTRLCQCLSPADAAALYERLLRDIVTKFQRHESSAFWLAFAPGGERYFSENYPAAGLLAQRGEDLGQRLHHIFVDLSGNGYGKVIIADTDSPGVPLSSIDEAYRQLGEEARDLVLGPSDDGGYYLVGLKRPVEGVFRDIPWSTDGVLARTLERARELELKVGILPPAYDIDVEADLIRLWNDFGASETLRELAPGTYDYLRSLTDGKLLTLDRSAAERTRRSQDV